MLSTATEMQFPPFDISDNGTYKGLNRDLIDAVGKEMGLKVSYLDLPWTSILPGLEAKKFDLCIAPVTITKERMKHYAFTVPIADATAALMKRADDKSIMKPEDIAGRTVGGQKGTSQLAQLKAFAAKLPKPVEVKEYVDNNQSYADLAAGRIDASVNSLPNLAYVAQQRSDTFADGGAAVRPADLFLLGRPARRQDADRRHQRRDPQGRGRRDDGEDPEDLVRTDDGPAEDGARALHLTAIQTEEQLESPSFETRRLRGAPQDEGLFHGRRPLPPRPEERCEASRLEGRDRGIRSARRSDRPQPDET